MKPAVAGSVVAGRHAVGKLGEDVIEGDGDYLSFVVESSGVADEVAQLLGTDFLDDAPLAVEEVRGDGGLDIPVDVVVRGFVVDHRRPAATVGVGDEQADLVVGDGFDADLYVGWHDGFERGDVLDAELVGPR